MPNDYGIYEAGGGEAGRRARLDAQHQPSNGLFGDAMQSSRDAGRSLNGALLGDNRYTTDILFGDQTDPGVLGTGYRKPGAVGVDNSLAQMPNYQQDRNQALSAALAAQGRGGPSMGAANIDQSQQAQFRNGQGALAQMLMAQAQGRGPSVAQQQLRAGTDRNIAQAMGMGQAMQGQNSGLAQRQLGQQAGMMGAQTNQDASMLRLQEQMQAQNQLGQVLAGARGQDIGLATEQAGLNQGANSSNLAALLQQRGLNDAQSRFYDQSAFGMDAQQGANNMALMQLLQQNGMQNQQLQQGAYDAAANRRAGLVPTALGAGGNAAGAAGQGIGSLLTTLGPALAAI